MRSSLVVRASDCQCTSCNGGPEFYPSIRRHSGIWGVADEAVLNIVRKNIKIPPKNSKKADFVWPAWSAVSTVMPPVVVAPSYCVLSTNTISSVRNSPWFELNTWENNVSREVKVAGTGWYWLDSVVPGQLPPPPPHKSLTTITSSVVASPVGRAALRLLPPPPPLALPPRPPPGLGPAVLIIYHAFRTAETETMALYTWFAFTHLTSLYPH